MQYAIKLEVGKMGTFYVGEKFRVFLNNGQDYADYLRGNGYGDPKFLPKIKTWKTLAGARKRLAQIAPHNPKAEIIDWA